MSTGHIDTRPVKALDWIIECIKDNKSDLFYGMSQDDINGFINFIGTLESTDIKCGKTEFPDLIANEGWIEHFEVDACGYYKGKNGARGSNYKSKVNPLKNNRKSVSYKDTETIEANSVQLQHRHSDFLISIRDASDNHIKSLINKGLTKSKYRVFMLVNSTFGLALKEEGNLNSVYSILKDVKTLELLYNYREYINYIIYISKRETRIIKVEGILGIIANIPNTTKVIDVKAVIKADELGISHGRRYKTS